jgi:hypothetical protein
MHVGLGKGIEPTIGQDNSRSKKCMDIWKDINCMRLLTGGSLNSTNCDVIDKEKAKRKVMEYYLQNGVLMYLNLFVHKLDDKKEIVENIHMGIGHFNEQIIMVEVNKRYFWHDHTKVV